MVVGEMPESVDLVVIGAGPGGYTAALEAATSGRQVHLIDKAGAQGVGGVSLLEGCVPSKALIEVAAAIHDEGKRRQMGVTPDGPTTVNLSVFQEWKDSIVTALGDGVRRKLAAASVTIIEGTAKFTGPTTLRVERENQASTILEFRNAIIATGSQAIKLPLLEGHARMLDAAGVMQMSMIPTNTVVVGAGATGIELGTALAKIGSKVTILEAAPSILPTFPPAVASDVLRGLHRLGISVMLGARLDGVTETAVRVTDSGGDMSLIDADIIVAALGRRPYSDGLAAERAGVTLGDSGYIVVDEFLMATDQIAAIGDVTAGPGLAHRAGAEAIAAVRTLGGQRTRQNALIPHVVFSDPEAATVGLGLAEAIALGYPAEEITVPFAEVAKSRILQDTSGRHRITVDASTGILLGASITGNHATELIAEMGLAIEAGLLYDDVTGTVHSHPTLSEIVTATHFRPINR
ncbi:MAG: NAD(P)/FAD-dependent oxidoreductase [Microbacteriaceae bacterium]|nr:MAG: NAD(P)/FAD-dependent oxidoreductase [Microbacteriaceae bacterium]